MLRRPESAETMVTPLSPVERVDLLVGGGKLLTMDASRRLIEDGAVAIADDTIRAVGTRAELESKYKADKFIDARGALILPGLINGHAHAPMSLFRGLADDLSLEDWLQKHIFPAEAANVNEEFVACGTRLSILEMLRAGITTYADMYYFEDVVARITRETGMRGILGETSSIFPLPTIKLPRKRSNIRSGTSTTGNRTRWSSPPSRPTPSTLARKRLFWTRRRWRGKIACPF